MLARLEAGNMLAFVLERQCELLQGRVHAVGERRQLRGCLAAQGSAPTASQGIALLTYTLSGDALQAKQNYAIAEYYVRRIHPTQS